MTVTSSRKMKTLKLLRHCFLKTVTKLYCDHSHINVCANRKLHKRKTESEYCLNFFFNFVYLLVNFCSSHLILNYEIKYVENFFLILIYQCKGHVKVLSCFNEAGKPRWKFPQFFRKRKRLKSIFSSQQIDPILLVWLLRETMF